MRAASYPGSRPLPGGLGIWVFIFTDLLLFGLYFLALMHDSVTNKIVFTDGRSNLHALLGIANTMILLTSSWCVALGVKHSSTNTKRAARYFAVGACTGALFIVIKSVEYHLLIGAGHTVIENRFYTWYFMLTGYHAFHVLLGLAALSILSLFLHRGTLAGENPVVRTIANYWHMVDLLWLGLFSFLYLV